MSEDGPTLEQRLRRLDDIVARLEGSDLEIDDALALFEEGVAHLREARRIVRDSELRIERLLTDARGDAVVEPLDDEP